MASSSAKVVYIKTANDEILTLKINLVGAKPKIWRRVKVPGVFTLGDLHYVIQIAMGWENYHLHVFRVGDRSFAIPMEEDPDFRDQDADSVTLSDLHLAKEGARFSYEYDFGDGWEHEIIVERVTRRNRARSYPYCEKAVRACPPEDCGGVYGYQRLLRILRNPKHSEHEEMQEWLGDDALDPKFVDIDEINKHLAIGFAT